MTILFWSLTTSMCLSFNKSSGNRINQLNETSIIEVNGSFDEINVKQGFLSRLVSFDTMFSTSSDVALQYEVSSNNDSIVIVEFTNDELFNINILEIGKVGATSILLSAIIPDEDTLTVEIPVIVRERLIYQKPINGLWYWKGFEQAQIDLTESFIGSDSSTILYDLNIENTEIITAELSADGNIILMNEGSTIGETTFSLNAFIPNMDTLSIEIPVEVLAGNSLFQVTTLNTGANNLISSKINNSKLLDSSNYIMVAHSGYSIFNGKTFESFNFDYLTDFGNNITVFEEDEQLIFINYGGIRFVSGEEVTVLNDIVNDSPSRFYGVKKHSEESFYLAASDGNHTEIEIYQTADFKEFNSQLSYTLSENEVVTGFGMVDTEEFFIFLNTSVKHYKNGEWFTLGEQNYRYNRISELYKSANGNYYLKGENAILKYDGSEITVLYDANIATVNINTEKDELIGLTDRYNLFVIDLNTDIIQQVHHNIWEDIEKVKYPFDNRDWIDSKQVSYFGENGFLLSTNDGLFVVENRNNLKGTHSIYTTYDGLPNNEIIKIYQGKESDIWYYTGGGISKLSNDKWNFKGEDTFLKYVDREGNAWSGGDNSLIKITPNDEVIDYSLYLNGGSTVAVTILSDEKIYVSTLGSGIVFTEDEINWEYITTESGLLSNNIKDVFIDSKGRTWVLYFPIDDTGKSVTVIENGNYTHFDQEDLTNNWVNDVIEDNSGNIWLATYSGLIKYNLSNEWEEKQDVFPNGKSDGLETFKKDNSGNIWMLYSRTEELGVSVMQDEKITHLSEDEGLFSNSVTDVVFIASNSSNSRTNSSTEQVILGGTKGISRLTMNFLNSDSSSDEDKDTEEDEEPIDGDVTDIKGIESEIIKIYPNPASDILNIQFPSDAKNSQLTIRTYTGTVLFDKQLNIYNSTYTMDISSFIKGLYLIEINTGKVFKKTKFLKQ
ncbi:T9SS type A sorting domain-containing protein [Flammeovirga pectinis]|nr:T9SS type A sorting domain-containing protein [Flammeovirga pectinis]